jgi:hypothetical protein
LRRAPRGTCADRLDRREPEPLLFEYPHRAVSRLADAKGAVTEQEIVDLVEVAARGAARVRHRSPMEIRAGRELDGSVRVMVASYSDLWLPWCSAREEPGADIEDFADNTELARRHTPRLNELLARLADAAAELGGSWQLAAGPGHHRPGPADPAGRPGRAVGRPATNDPLVRPGRGRVGGVRGTRRAAHRGVLAARRPADPPYRAVLRTSITAPRHPLHTADRSQPRRALRDDRNALTVAELAEVAEVEVDNRLDRHRFTVPDLAD